MIGLEYMLNIRSMKHHELAQALGITKQNINYWTKGARKIPLKYLPQLSEIFNVPTYYFNKEITIEDINWESTPTKVGGLWCDLGLSLQHHCLWVGRD